MCLRRDKSVLDLAKKPLATLMRVPFLNLERSPARLLPTEGANSCSYFGLNVTSFLERSKGCTVSMPSYKDEMQKCQVGELTLTVITATQIVVTN